MKISVIVPVKDEAADLPSLLKSLSFADEVIVIDTGSMDNSIEIAQEMGAKVVREKFIDFSQIRNFGTGLAKNDWILSLDADNEVTPELAKEIDKLPDPPQPAGGFGGVSAYKIGRINFIWGRPILHADWGPDDDCHIRLYHRGSGEFKGTVHEQFVTNSAIKKLRGRLLHYNYSSISEYITKLNVYSQIEADERRSHKQKFSYWSLFFEPLYDFGKRYFYKLGFLEGWHGFYLCLLQSYFFKASNIKLATDSLT